VEGGRSVLPAEKKSKEEDTSRERPRDAFGDAGRGGRKLGNFRYCGRLHGKRE